MLVFGVPIYIYSWHAMRLNVNPAVRTVCFDSSDFITVLQEKRKFYFSLRKELCFWSRLTYKHMLTLSLQKPRFRNKLFRLSLTLILYLCVWAKLWYFFDLSVVLITRDCFLTSYYKGYLFFEWLNVNQVKWHLYFFVRPEGWCFAV